jgi:hypothetical protein
MAQAEAVAQVVQSWNEWDPLEEVVVGSVLGATLDVRRRGSLESYG